MAVPTLPPAIVPFEGIEAQFRLSAEEQLRLALIPLAKPHIAREGIAPHAILTHGAPGAGKTAEGYRRLKAYEKANGAAVTVVAYDEKGACFEIPAYQDGLERLYRSGALPSYAEREQLFLENRQDSQRIRSLTFNLALDARRDVYVDTVAGGKGAIMMAETLARIGYTTEVWSYHAPWPISEARVADRFGRVLETQDTVCAKRVGALETMPVFMKNVDRFIAFYNPSDERPSEEIIRLEKGFPDIVRADGTDALRRMWLDDVTAFRTNRKLTPRNYSDRLEASVKAAGEALNEIAPRLPASHAGRYDTRVLHRLDL